VNFRKLIVKRIRRQDGGVQVAGDVNAVISANLGERGSSSHVSSSQSARVEQRSADPEARDERKEDADTRPRGDTPPPKE
jgi:hypothetical protein